MHIQRAKHYLQSRVTCQFWRLVVDGYDSHWDGDGEAPAPNLISRGWECKTVLCALGAVMHVEDLSTFHLEETKKGSRCHSILNQTWMVRNKIGGGKKVESIITMWLCLLKLSSKDHCFWESMRPSHRVQLGQTPVRTGRRQTAMT